MRSLVQAIALFTNAISAALAEALNPLAGDPLLIWNYGVFAVLAFGGGCMFILQFRGLDAQEDELNNLPEGQVVANKDIESYEEREERHVPVEITEKQ